MLGVGGVGGFLAAALARAGEDVVVVARESVAEVLSKQGIAVSSARLGDFHARPRAVAVLAEPVEVLFIACKAPALEDALKRVTIAPRLVVPLLNGRDHLTTVRRLLAAPVVAASIRIESTRLEAGVISQTSPFLRVDLASDELALAPRLGSLVARLQVAGIPAEVLSSEAQVVWSKLVRLNALACTTSAADLALGEIRGDPQWRALLEGAVREAAQVARAEGAEVRYETAMAELEDAHAELRSSMQRDIAAGRPTELDAIAGAVLRAGARHGVPTPTVRHLAELVARRAGEPPPG